MTKASSARNERRRKNRNPIRKALNAGYERGFKIGMVSFANQAQSPEGFKLPDGRVARLVIEGEATPAPIGVVDPPRNVPASYE